MSDLIIYKVVKINSAKKDRLHGMISSGLDLRLRDDIEFYQSKEEADGNVHTIPLDGKEHVESKFCWCDPELDADYTEQGGVQHYSHRELQ